MELMYFFGVEYWYDNQFVVCVGYFNEYFQKGGWKYLMVGLGLKYNIFGLNFFYFVLIINQWNLLDNILWFFLLFDFGLMGEFE